MGTIYNGIGLNTTEAIRNKHSLGNVIELTGYAFINNGDPSGTSHILYDKSAVTYQNQQAVLNTSKPLKLPAGASISKIYLKNLSWGVNPESPPNPTWLGWNAPGTYNLIATDLVATSNVYTSAQVLNTITNITQTPDINLGTLIDIASTNVSTTAGYQYVTLMNNAIDPGSGIVVLSSVNPPPLTQVVVEVTFVLFVQ